MSSALIDALRLNVSAIKNVVQLHEFSRDLFYSTKGAGGDDLWGAVRQYDPGSPAWQIYDHCAALLRLYAVYSIFVEDLVADYLQSLPHAYGTYDRLPEPVLRQHRIGFGQIMLKLGDSGPYRHLKESEIILQLSNGMAGVSPYKLLKEAFFVERQNYRSEILARLFGNLGIENICTRVGGHPSMRSFIETRLGNATTFESELDGFVTRRNEAAHGSVEEVISTGQFLTIADFVLVACETLEEIVMREMLLCFARQRPGAQIGIVSHAYHAGRTAIVKTVASTISVGEDVALVRRQEIRIAKVLSIQLDGRAISSLACADGQELGVALDQKCHEGEMVRRISWQTTAPLHQQALFPIEETELAPSELAALNESEQLPSALAADEENTNGGGGPQKDSVTEDPNSAT